MPAAIAHLVIGEQVGRRLFPRTSEECAGSFYTGCMLVDVHAFQGIDRRRTHFVGSMPEEGEDPFQSCSRFLRELDSILLRSWKDLIAVEKSFVYGYFCHLAADECWRDLGRRICREKGVASWSELRIPDDVGLINFDYMSHPHLADKPEMDRILRNPAVPDVFRHIPQKAFLRQWEIIRDYVFAGGTPESNFRMLECMGRPAEEIRETRRRFDAEWERGLDFLKGIGGVMPFLQDAVERSVRVLPFLLDRS